MKMPDILLKWDTRSCVVDGVYGEFQLWEPSDPVRAVVEFPDGVRRVDAEKVQFCDNIHAYICDTNEIRGGEAQDAG